MGSWNPPRHLLKIMSRRHLSQVKKISIKLLWKRHLNFISNYVSKFLLTNCVIVILEQKTTWLQSTGPAGGRIFHHINLF